MFTDLLLNAQSPVPIYRQIYEEIKLRIQSGFLQDGLRLPPTRELAGQLGLNRTTVSAAYALLEEDGLIRGHVGRGSYVAAGSLAPSHPPSAQVTSFASSRPAVEDFPLEDFQAICRQVTSGSGVASILQLGSPSGYGPLRSYLLAQARAEGVAGAGDDVLITNGCQQAIDLVQRTFAPEGTGVVLEDPVYHGLKNVFVRGASRITGLPVGPDGIAIEPLARVLLEQRPRLLLVTPNFQNPTGACLSLDARQRIVRLARECGTLVVENDMYGSLRYAGEALPTIKQLAAGGGLLLRSFSKIAFPGLRVGWIVGPRELIAQLTETRQWCDLHGDQLSQAILLRFAETGRLERHLQRVRASGRLRLNAMLAACEQHLPPGSAFTRPEGGMSLWVKLPRPLDAGELLARAQRDHVDYLPGRYFSVSQYDPGTLRLSFGALQPSAISWGVETLGRIFHEEIDRGRSIDRFEAAPAMV